MNGERISRPALGPFHPGELQAQAMAGVRVPGNAIRDFMPEQHREFFAMLRFLLLAAVDSDGWPVATLLSGEPGFVSSPDSFSLDVLASSVAQDEVRPLLLPGRPVGLLGIDFASRRRNRANGVVRSMDDKQLHVAVKESFGNCPKYIRMRELDKAPCTSRTAPVSVELFDGLDRAARDAVSAADTFFVASSSGEGNGSGLCGSVDISHRGGEPGFIAIDGDTLSIPDFSGNRYFNTFGNLLLEPRAAFLFVDFLRGDLLQLQGIADIDWGVHSSADKGAPERRWRLRVVRGCRRIGAVPLRWQPPQA